MPAKDVIVSDKNGAVLYQYQTSNGVRYGYKIYNGPEKKTVVHSEDGFHFEEVAKFLMECYVEDQVQTGDRNV